MSCPHRSTESIPLPPDLHERPSRNNMLSSAEDRVFIGLDEVMRRIFNKRVISSAVAKVNLGKDWDPEKTYHVDFGAVAKAIPEKLTHILGNICEMSRQSSEPVACRFARLLNNFVDLACYHFGLPDDSMPRLFTCAFGFESTESKEWLSDMDLYRRPEVVLVNRDKTDKDDLSWEDIKVPVVVFDDLSCTERAYRQLLSFAYRIFFDQSRNFVLGVAFLGSFLMVFLFDRSGVYVSHHVPLTGSLFTRFMTGLVFLEDYQLGLDISVVIRDGKEYVQVNGVEYPVKGYLFRRWDLFGTGTVIRLVERNEKVFISKDVWAVRGSDANEPETMRGVRGVDNVAQLENHEYLKYPSGEDVSNEPFWKAIVDSEKFKRTPKCYRHLQLIMSPYGDRLNSFRSLEELVSALRDVAYAIKGLANRGVCHADVSHRNIVLVPNGSLDEPRKGCLIDFGVSVNKSFQRKGARGQFFYMSLPVIFSGAFELPVRYRSYHDLESLLYVLCWECTCHDGPLSSYVSADVTEGSVITRWQAQNAPKGEEWKYAWREKSDDVETAEDFENNVLSRFQPYFRDLIPCAKALRDILIKPTYSLKQHVYYQKRHEALLEEKEVFVFAGMPDDYLDDEIEANWQLYLNSRLIEDQEEEILDKVLTVWDDTLDMIRLKGETTAVENEEYEEYYYYDSSEDEEEIVEVRQQTPEYAPIDLPNTSLELTFDSNHDDDWLDEGDTEEPDEDDPSTSMPAIPVATPLDQRLSFPAVDNLKDEERQSEEPVPRYDSQVVNTASTSAQADKSSNKKDHTSEESSLGVASSSCEPVAEPSNDCVDRADKEEDGRKVPRPTEKSESAEVRHPCPTPEEPKSEVLEDVQRRLKRKHTSEDLLDSVCGSASGKDALSSERPKRKLRSKPDQVTRA